MQTNQIKKFNRIFTLILFSSLVLAGCGNDQMDSYPLPEENTISDNSVKTPSTKEEVTISIIEKGRKNPFRSYQEKNLVLGNDPVLGKIPMPPKLNPNPDIDSLLSVQISGILYDNKKPSALISINNEEHLVHKNDTLFDFEIHDITPDKVVISKGQNVYKAGIGEIIDEVPNGSSQDLDPRSLPTPNMNHQVHLSTISEPIDDNEETIVIK